MAQLIATPKSIRIEMEFRDGESIDTYLARSEAAMEKLETESDALMPDELVGALISFPRADGYAFYRVASITPLKLQHIPYGDAYCIDSATIRGLRLSDVAHMVSAAKRIKAIFASRG